MDITSPESRDDRLRQAKIDEIDPSKASTQASKSGHNELAPISRLPCEVLAIIFTFLSLFAWKKKSGILAWIYAAHVCRRWRETALNHPRFWSHINLAKLKPVGMAGVLSRAKMVPLHLEAGNSNRWDMELFEHLEVIGKQLEAHIFHTRHLELSGRHLSTLAKRLVLPAPSLESLTLSHSPPPYGAEHDYFTIPDNLFNCTAPSLTTLILRRCDIGWKSPLLKGLRTLKILGVSEEARPELNDWLDILNEMPQLKVLSLRDATPVAPLSDLLISRTVTLPSLNHFHIEASAKDCALALAHLVLPTLTRLNVNVESHERDGEDALRMIPYIVPKLCVLQDNKPIRSILIDGGTRGWLPKVLLWTPGADAEVCESGTLVDISRSACFLMAVKGHDWNYGTGTTIFDAILTLLPMASISNLTAQYGAQLSKRFWLRHASRLPLLEQARLDFSTVREFGEMLAEDIPLDSDGPRLPMLTKLILFNLTLTTTVALGLHEILLKRVEQGAPLEHLDLRACDAKKDTTQLLAEIIDLQL